MVRVRKVHLLASTLLNYVCMDNKATIFWFIRTGLPGEMIA